MKEDTDKKQRSNMGQILIGGYKVVFAIILLLVTWFALGSWLRSQPSTIAYWIGTVLNFGIVAPVAYIIKNAIVNNFAKLS